MLVTLAGGEALQLSRGQWKVEQTKELQPLKPCYKPLGTLPLPIALIPPLAIYSQTKNSCCLKLQSKLHRALKYVLCGCPAVPTPETPGLGGTLAIFLSLPSEVLDLGPRPWP